MKEKEKYSKWIFMALPALSMMLGWGLRGHIGGGPFGAMIPGAMLALSIGLLFELPASATSVLVVFGVVGIGLGGEMTYGQTLGFLRNPETVWWGTAGTTLKGAVWGLLGGAVFSQGFFFRRISGKTLISAFLFLFLGMFAGFKLVNDPMILYFSDPVKPRPESWAALLFGAVAMLFFLKFKTSKNDFAVIARFAVLGMIGGALGFGLGGFWMVLGSNLPDVIFKSWWKAMEFTFGLLLGVSFGYAAWISRFKIRSVADLDWKNSESPFQSLWLEIGLIFMAAIITYWLIPITLEPLANATRNAESGAIVLLGDVLRLLVNYAFYGFLFILVIIRFPKIAWQLGITLTFCHAAIDLIRDFFPETNTMHPFTLYFLLVFLMTTTVAILVARFSRRKKSIQHLFYLLIWSSITVSFLRMAINPGTLHVTGLSFCQVICGKFIVDLFFLVSAILLSFFIARKFKPVS